MNKLFTALSLMIIATACSAETTVPAEEPTSITIKVEGVRGDKGKVLLGIYDDADEFANNGTPVSWLAIPATTTSVTLDAFPMGTFAVSAFHDANEDNALNMRNELPTEGYGSSGSVGRFSQPSFEDASFTGSQAHVQIHYLD